MRLARILGFTALAAMAVGIVHAQTNGALYAAKTFTFECVLDGGACTGSAPTDATDGVALTSAAGYNVSVDLSPDGGSTTAASGGLKCYYYQADYSTGVHGTSPTRGWAAGATSLDVSAIGTSVRRYTAPTYSVGVGAGRVKCVPNAVVLNGLSALPDGGANIGTSNVNVTIEVQRVQTETR